ncbi:MAG TPA: RluA family pseudouridine synthase [Erysipelotrichaceae bacterium]|nr:RluA family pseudouridine synthase [Erysipelotrichaceae bacterium]
MREFIYKNEESQRLDVFLSENINDTSRAQLQKMIVNGEVLVNGEEKKSNYRLSLNDVVKVEEIVEEDLEVRPIDFEIEVLYEDDYLAVVNKPAGMVVYPGAGREEVSLVAALKGMKMKLSNPEDEMRNGIVHRLDKDTSGLMMIAKDNKTHDKLSKLLKKREVVRKYYTIVNGVVEHDFGTIDAPIGRDERNRIRRTVSGAGKDAITYFKVIERFKDFTFLECELTTGRTHQIRVHMKYIDHPILGDNLYGLKDRYNLESQLLQSYLIEFIHPYTNKQMSFKLDVRDDFKKLMKEVKS